MKSILFKAVLFAGLFAHVSSNAMEDLALTDLYNPKTLTRYYSLHDKVTGKVYDKISEKSAVLILQNMEIYPTSPDEIQEGLDQIQSAKQLDCFITGDCKTAQPAAEPTYYQAAKDWLTKTITKNVAYQISGASLIATFAYLVKKSEDYYKKQETKKGDLAINAGFASLVAGSLLLAHGIISA